MRLAFVALLLLVALGFMWALASYEGAHAEALQAQALITANQTTQVSVIGQTILSLVLVLLVLVTLVALVVIGLLVFKRSQAQPTNGWVSGPNAHWQKTGQLPGQANPAIGMSPQALYLQQQMMQQQLLTMLMMSQMGKPPEVTALPAPQDQPLENELPWWE